MNLKTIFRTYIVPLIVLIGGLMFFVTGIVKLVQVNTFPQTTAVITRIEVIPATDPDSSDEYNVYVRYTVDGKTYDGETDVYKESYREGGEITVRYNPKNPARITSLSTPRAIIILSVGVLFTAAGVVIGLRNLRTGSYPAA